MWRTVWQGGLTITAVWLLGLAWPKIPARVRCWCWRLAFIKVLVCLLWVTPVKLALLPAQKTMDPVLPAIERTVTASPVAIPTGTMSVGAVEKINVLPVKSRLTFAAGLFLFWLLGVTVCLIVLARQWWLMRQLIRHGVRLEDGQVEHDLALLAGQFGLRQQPEIRLVEDLETPLLTGWWHPVILMPASFLADKSSAQWRMILAHELAHIKRRDLGWTWLTLAARVLFFFHPLVLLARKESRLAEEMAADELTVTVCQLKPVDYGGLLVEVAARIFSPQHEELVVGVVGSHQTLKRRLLAMKYIQLLSNKRITAAAVLVALTGLAVIVPWRVVALSSTSLPSGLNTSRPATVTSSNSTLCEMPGRKRLAAGKSAAAEIRISAKGDYRLDGKLQALDKIIAQLKTAAKTNPVLPVSIQADQGVPLQELTKLLDALVKAKLENVAVHTEAGVRSTPAIFDIAFGVWRPEESKQVGPAAAGNEGDYWNTVGVAWNNDHTESGMKFASGEASPILVQMINLAGAWGSNGKMGVKAPMLDSYNYPMNNQGGNAQVILKGVPVGTYDLYIYGHESDPVAYGDYTLTVGDHSYGRKMTSNKSDAIENTSWVEGSQYVKYSGIKVVTGEELKILIQPGGQVTDHFGRVFTDASINGLQLIPTQ